MAATGVRRPVCFSGRGDVALRTASPAEVAGAVVYLASRQAQLASGSILDLNGASFLRM